MGGALDEDAEPRGRNEVSGASLRGVLEAFLRRMRFRGYVVGRGAPAMRGLERRDRLFEGRISLIVCREATSIVVDRNLGGGREGLNWADRRHWRSPE